MVELSREKIVTVTQWRLDNYDEVHAAVVDSEGNALVTFEQNISGPKLYAADKPSPEDSNYRQLEVPPMHYLVQDATLPGRIFVMSPTEIEAEFGYVAPEPEPEPEPVNDDDVTSADVTSNDAPPLGEGDTTDQVLAQDGTDANPTPDTVV